MFFKSVLNQKRIFKVHLLENYSIGLSEKKTSWSTQLLEYAIPLAAAPAPLKVPFVMVLSHVMVLVCAMVLVSLCNVAIWC